MSTYAAALEEARALLGDAKLLHGSTSVAVFCAPTSGEYFAVRGSRADVLKAEGFVLKATIDLGGQVTEL